MQSFERLKNTYPLFIYRGYRLDIQEELQIEYDFYVPGLATFKPRLTFPLDLVINQEDGVLNRLIFLIGMVELISYWKLTCSPKVQVDAGYLNEADTAFFKDLYYKGLGEFFYQNHIQVEPDQMMDLFSTCDPEPMPVAEVELTDQILLPIGGGKDSIVSLDVLQKAKRKILAFAINPNPATRDTIQMANISDHYFVKRQLDPQLLAFNKQGFLNGHTPFSALVAFVSLLSAYLTKSRYIALSNESSANESSVKGLDVNHQYSKSFDFEHRFQTYVAKRLLLDIHYFSLLRPFSELAIARYFSRLKKYHPVFMSCNLGGKENKWCGNCGKCLFVALILSPFLSSDELEAIFKKDILNDSKLIPLLDGLTGITDVKPFECVGTVDEAKISLALLDNKNYDINPKLLTYYKNREDLSLESCNKVLNTWDTAHAIPDVFINDLNHFLKE